MYNRNKIGPNADPCGTPDFIFSISRTRESLALRKHLARRGGAEVAGWTLDRKIRVRFPAYPHRVWAL